MMISHAERIVDRVSRSCSLDRVIVAGQESGVIGDRLRLLGAVVTDSDAGSVDTITRRLAGESADAYSLAVVCLVGPRFGDLEVRDLFVELRRIARSAYVQVLADSQVASVEPGGRSWLERRALASGFRRHPLAPRLLRYEDLDSPTDAPWVLLDGVLDCSEPSPLDDLRTCTTDANAVLTRYERASHFVRRHDRVLDLDCGVGAGLTLVGPAALAESVTGIVRNQTDLEYATKHYTSSCPMLECRIDDPVDLSQFEDESTDVVLSCRPLPDTFWCGPALVEIRRVLTPGGRLICCVDSADVGIGRRIADTFLLERAFTQAGPPLGPGALSAWHEVDPDAPHQASRDGWWMFVAMKDPRSGKADTYRERLFPHVVYPGGRNPTAYVGAFENPWLHTSVFLQGARVTRGALLDDLCRDIAEGNGRSMDGAAARCVLGYRLLEAPQVASASVHAWLDEVRTRLRTLTGEEPATVRWRISLLFLAGRLAMRLGDTEAARRHFRACMAEDATHFSSLLATKTIEAAFWAGCLDARAADRAAAADAWRRGIAIAKSCIAAEAASNHDVEQRLELFGFREFSHVFDAAGVCAAALASLSAGDSWESRLSLTTRHGSVLSSWRSALNEARWALADERRLSRQAIEQAESIRQPQLLAVRSAACEALLRQAIYHCQAARRSVLVWGAGAAGRHVLEVVEQRGGRVDGFIDSDLSKQDTRVAGRLVIAPQSVGSARWAGSFILIASAAAGEIETRATDLGLVPHADFVRVDVEAALALPAYEPARVGDGIPTP